MNAGQVISICYKEGHVSLAWGLNADHIPNG
jgi:hypothetical protein